MIAIARINEGIEILRAVGATQPSLELADVHERLNLRFRGAVSANLTENIVTLPGVLDPATDDLAILLMNDLTGARGNDKPSPDNRRAAYYIAKTLEQIGVSDVHNLIASLESWKVESFESCVLSQRSKPSKHSKLSRPHSNAQ